MKKLALTLLIFLGLGFGAMAQNDDKGLFGMGFKSGGDYDSYNKGGDNPSLLLPTSHGDGNDSPAPLGTGTVLLLGLGAAYLVTKKNRKE